MKPDWSDEINIAVTVCDTEGNIVYMNQRSAVTFAKDGGFNLLGRNLMECHPEPARSKLVDLLENPRENVYTIEKHGQKKMIYQVPWYIAGGFAGLVEFALPLPPDIPHFIRK